MIAYKVVRKVKGKKLSLYCGIPKYEIEYKEGQIIVPKMPSSLIFVCPTFNNAVEWQRFNSNFEIWQVEVQETIPIIKSVLIPNDKEIEVFWGGTPKEKANLVTNDEELYGCISLVMKQKIK